MAERKIQLPRLANGDSLTQGKARPSGAFVVMEKLGDGAARDGCKPGA
jgi:hypothetical protein